MKKRKNIIVSAVTCMLSICLLMFGVYAGSNPNVSINGQVSYKIHDAAVLVQGTMQNDKMESDPNYGQLTYPGTAPTVQGNTAEGSFKGLSTINIPYSKNGSNSADTYQSANSGTNSNTNTAAPAYQSGNTAADGTAYDYIGNKNSMKFHYPECTAAGKMKETNKVYLHCTREKAIADGYTPCGQCNP